MLCLLLGGFDKSLHIVPKALLERVQCFRKDIKGCRRDEHKTYGPLDDYWVILSTSKAYDYLRARRDEICFVFDPPWFVDHRRRRRERFLPKHILETKFR